MLQESTQSVISHHEGMNTIFCKTRTLIQVSYYQEYILIRKCYDVYLNIRSTDITYWSANLKQIRLQNNDQLVREV
jgi:hypothetical protein